MATAPTVPDRDRDACSEETARPLPLANPASSASASAWRLAAIVESPSNEGAARVGLGAATPEGSAASSARGTTPSAWVLSFSARTQPSENVSFTVTTSRARAPSSSPIMGSKSATQTQRPPLEVSIES
eukprot:Amastigsp_a342383_21.p2 type:complete len:129 gc:universal Amastigsp_a342383_21:396-782(+)